MKMWLLGLDVNKYNSFDGYEVEKSLNIKFYGNSLADMWVSPLIKTYYKKRKVADVSDFSTGAPLFNEKAVESLRGFLHGNVELLPAYYENVKYYVVNIVNVIDALDYEKSEFERFDTGAIMYCTKYSFKPKNVETQHIFKIPLCNSIDIFVSDEFKKRVEEDELKGFLFAEAWNSEESNLQDNLELEKVQTKENMAVSGITQESEKEKVKIDYPEISEMAAKELLEKLNKSIFDVSVQYVKEAIKERGILDSIGLEYFFDGQYTDIGVRINVLLDSTEDEYKDLYYQLLEHPNISFDFNTLYTHYIKDYMNEEETDVFYKIIQQIIFNLNKRIQDTKWETIAKVTEDFSVVAPELYD